MQNQNLSAQNATLAGQVDKLQSYRTNLEKMCIRDRIVSDADWVKACTALGQVRLDIARKHGLIDPDKFNFLWVCLLYTSRCV